MSRRDTGGNANRVQAVQQLRRSGAAGAHKQQDQRPRAEVLREALEDQDDYDQEDN